jgi:hypothetical protein
MIQLHATFLGIDPGKSGGLAMITSDGIDQVFKMPETESDIARLFEERIKPAGVSFCYIEKVHSFPGEGVSSSFKFGKNTGLLIGLLLAHKISFEEKMPIFWQRALGIPPRRKKPTEELKREFKNRLKDTAQKLFPHLKVTLKTADALLIAEAARRITLTSR